MVNSGLLYKFPLRNLNRLGLLSTTKISRALFIITYVIVLLFLFALILVLMQFFYMTGEDVTAYVNNFEAVGILIQVPSKWCSCLYYKQNFLNMVAMIDKFWNEDQCSATSKKNIKIITKRAMLLQKIFVYSILMLPAGITPYCIIQRNICIGEWHMEKGGMFGLAWITIYISAIILTYFTGFYECLFLGFCCVLQIQCKILASHLERLNAEAINWESQFKNYIKHHRLLLEFHNELQNFYAIPLLVQYLTAAPIMCAEMYALTESSHPLMMVRYTISLFASIFQIVIYCIPANFVEHEMETISTAIYNSDWYSKYSTTMRTPIILMIQRAQQKVTLSACGLVEINIDTFVKLLKMAYSVNVALKGLKKSN